MKRYIKTNKQTAPKITLASVLQQVPKTDDLSIQNNHGVLFLGTVSDLLNISVFDSVMDPEGYEYEVGAVLDSEVSLIRSFANTLVIGVEI